MLGAGYLTLTRLVPPESSSCPAAAGRRNGEDPSAGVSYPRQVSNPCRFCRATDRKITREHVWPDWLRDYLPPFDEDADIERWSPGTSRQGWSQPFLATTVRAFCDGCNSGWMADIEAAAKPIVGPMVIGQPTELDAGAQQIVASWVALKGQVAAQASKLDPGIPEPHYAGVYNVRGAPANTMRMWVGHRWILADHQPGRAQICEWAIWVTNG